MSKSAIIKAPVNEEMKSFEKHFLEAMDTNIPLLKTIVNYMYRRKGKQLRPVIVFLTAKLLGEVTDKTYTAASMLELLHTATLIHDDVVDEAYQRRGAFSINALWRSKIAVLVGDFLLSKGLLLSVKHKTYDLLEIMSEAVREMSEGELLQIEKSRKQDVDEDTYFEIIRKKTATLIASCAANGACSVNASDETIEEMRLFGEYLGIAFQIKDDLLDYTSSSVIGKPSYQDIKEKKLTLPLIFALSKASSKEKHRVLKIVRRHNKNSTKVKEVVNFVKSSGGIEYTIDRMNQYRDKAIDILNKYPDSDERKALITLVEYAVERVK
ncbi:MAG: polyprenyl synthetase family protein [Bacteroidales bacterium]|jgi:octaprenyl-diphosphate synthase|nr:polyprenyl synthetase family protein [Bacteroidales bacterium]